MTQPSVLLLKQVFVLIILIKSKSVQPFKREKVTHIQTRSYFRIYNICVYDHINKTLSDFFNFGITLSIFQSIVT